MSQRALSISLAVLLAVGLLVPSAAAQSFKITAKWGNDHATMKLPKDGRGNMPITIRVEASGFTCAQPYEFNVNAVIETSFANWAGSSIEGSPATFTFAAGEPGTAPYDKSISDKIRLNFAWDPETAPATGAEQDYIVTPEFKPSQSKTGPCAPQPPNPPTLVKTASMKVSLPDRVGENATEGDPCEVDPTQAKCQTAPPPAEDSPAPGVMILLGAVGLVAYMRRRYEK